MDTSRRKALRSITQAMGLVSIGGLIWGAYIAEAKSNPLGFYPPGARDDFINTCIRCGLCVEACPYYTLSLATKGVKGIPTFTPRKIPCFMCKDIPCVRACPTDALDKNLLLTHGKLDITKARMGVAVVDTLNCIAYAGIQCDACYRACPLMDQAIYLEYKANTRTGKHAMILPIVANDVCTGCGKCEKACVTEIASIKVMHREQVLGKMGANYIKGWDQKDEERLESARPKSRMDSPKKQTLDYLNDGIL
ncbi:ferredoxin-type protein NapG [Helicobacter mustelae]|uniref:Putative NapG ferredoxin-type protein n=1 Tax=Helicobacter mustelae (strain ATCC 43772 / CCUG 25715 / CIP 103759 / LMG 18044 / NCTC 12198 / R85-136P) TaxID=679897 RepID=D3UIP0_HELM1|nr:ferredoxin-type protein NapG [Helicobacter mustelae]CBG40365.1 putative NapG ferredoxin-type protein [Helicobacter mustelae 12198]SQH71864.1 NapG ferredoxin-type protein [Helicobacter mustelae]STP13003.1 NapG ferredoxin-type protein [Helicobacter mustelae]